MSLPIPCHVLDKMQSALSNMKCKPSQLPAKLETVDIEDGKFRVYFDGNICILLQLPKLDDSKIIEHGKQFVFFYEHTFSMFAATLNKGSDSMPVLIGDGFYYMPCGEALFHMMKASLFKDWDAFEKIYYAATPKICKAAARGVQGFDEKTWVEKRAAFVGDVARLKLQCPDVKTTFDLLDESALKNGIPVENTFFYEATTKDQLYATGLSINVMVQLALQQPKIQAMQQIVEPITPLKLGGLCYPGENLLGLAVTDSFKLFVELGGAGRTIDEMMVAYKERFGKSFHETSLTAEETFDAQKKLKLNGDVYMEEVLREASACEASEPCRELFDGSAACCRTGSA